MIKISSQAKQLAEMNEDMCAAAEYIKLCESRLESYEAAEAMAPSKTGFCGRMQIDCEQNIEKLEEEIRSKDQLYISSAKKAAELSKDLRNLQSKLQTSQDSLRLANFLAGPKTAAHQSKMDRVSSSESIDYRAEINHLRMKLGLAKEKDRMMTTKVSHLEETLAAQSRHVHVSHRNLMMMKLTKQDQQTEKQATEKRIMDRSEVGEGCGGGDVDKFMMSTDVKNDVNSAYLIEIKKRDDTISSLEEIVRHLEESLSAAEGEQNGINLSEISSRIEVLEDERDTLLEVIQVNLNSPIYIRLLNKMLMILVLRR